MNVFCTHFSDIMVEEINALIINGISSTSYRELFKPGTATKVLREPTGRYPLCRRLIGVGGLLEKD